VSAQWTVLRVRSPVSAPPVDGFFMCQALVNFPHISRHSQLDIGSGVRGRYILGCDETTTDFPKQDGL
jgi:hypothetical protein